MPKEIWSEGRVVGLSSYEVYVKQHMSEDPLTPPASEREWLASSLAMGTSMLLKVPNINQGAKEHRSIEIYLPNNSKIAAANTIVAQFFDGQAEFGNGSWATRITDYGQLISNNSTSSPSGVVGPTGTVPTQTLSEWSDDTKTKLKEYMRIYDGIVIQPGTWVDSEVKPPEKDFQANLGSGYARVRLHIRGKIANNPLVLLTGFTLRSVLAGIVGSDTVTESASPQDGDFLGPAVFPWSAKIVFCVPNSYVTYFDGGGYQRDLESPTLYQNDTMTTNATVEKLIKDTAVIDMQASKPETFYASYSDYASLYTSQSPPSNPRHQYNVDDFVTLGDAPTDGAAVLTIYQKRTKYPPALYGTFVGTKNTHYMNPIDVVAPGTVKMFNNQAATVLQDYQNTFPGTTGMNKTADGTIQILNSQNNIVDLVKITDTTASIPKINGGNSSVKVIQVTTGKRAGWALAMSAQISTGNNQGQPVAPSPLNNVSAKPTNVLSLTASNSNDNISWAALFEGLSENKAIDVLGNRLRETKYTLQKPIKSTHAQEVAGRSNRLNTGIGNAYIQFGPDSEDGKSAIRLYISTIAPNTTDVPEGSIGIGWGLEY